jgi:hypothetical protein
MVFQRFMALREQLKQIAETHANAEGVASGEGGHRDGSSAGGQAGGSSGASRGELGPPPLHKRRGGARKGAGRPRGSTKAKADAARQLGVGKAGRGGGGAGAAGGRVVEVVVQAQLGGQAQLGERSQVVVEGSGLKA